MYCQSGSLFWSQSHSALLSWNIFGEFGKYSMKSNKTHTALSSFVMIYRENMRHFFLAIRHIFHVVENIQVDFLFLVCNNTSHKFSPPRIPNSIPFWVIGCYYLCTKEPEAIGCSFPNISIQHTVYRCSDVVVITLFSVSYRRAKSC